jgi:hypothetical protein
MAETHYMIYGRKKGERGGAYFGISADTNEPVFGGGNLIYAPVWWDTPLEVVEAICARMMVDYPDYECEVRHWLSELVHSGQALA